MTSPVVLKFGGSSLGTPGRLAHVLAIIAVEASRGPVSVVVSAFGDTTDDLIRAGEVAEARNDASARAIIADIARANRARAIEAAGAALPEADAPIDALVDALVRLLEGVAIVGELSPAARDEVLSFGERMSSVLVAAALRARGVPAAAVDARDWAVTDARHGDATILWEPTQLRLGALCSAAGADGTVFVHTGFLGRTEAGRTTTLGRNGSDYTAAVLARGLGARELTIWTDVSGVMTADPSLVEDAYPVARLSYREALELAGLGLKMLHPRTVLPLVASGIPMRIRNTMRPDDPGTCVDAVGSSDANRPTCVTSLEDMALIDVEGSQRSAGASLGPRAATALAVAGVPVWFETQAPRGNGVALVVGVADVARAIDALGHELAREIARGDLDAPRVHAPVTLLTLVAEAMGQTVNVAGRFFGALGAVGVNVRASSQGATSRAISCVVDAGDTPVAVRTVHAALNLAREQVSIVVLGKGTVGSHLLAQLAAERGVLLRAHELDLRLVGLVDRRHMCFDAGGIDPHGALARLADGGVPVDLVALLERLARLPAPVLVDCSSGPDMADVYHAAFARGIHVVAANKQPLTLPTPAQRALFAAARRAHRAYRYETTVGASLPVVETLKNLVRTGDRVRLIEGSLSGTLGFLSDALSEGVRLSEAVRDAHARGYTESHPRDDLGGLDAARKALILARELGYELELEDVTLEPFVGREALSHDDLGAFFAALEAEDEAFTARMRELRAAGKVLRYLARIETPHHEDQADGTGGQPVIRVGPVGVDVHHPAARLRGTEAFVAFTTERYHTYPLVVQGPGAGGPVTAAGVLADILAVSQSLRGR